MKGRILAVKVFNILLALAVSGVATLVPVVPVLAAGVLDIEIIAGYNLVVDSNVTSPSTYAPRVATVIGKFCNTGTDPLTGVYGYIGDGTTPGSYPIRDSATDAEFQSGEKWNYLYNTGNYFFRHVGAASDASRYIGTIPAGECRYQYWTIEYPACENVGGNWAEPPCTGDPLWGTSVKPDDDLSLQFDIWGHGYDASQSQTRSDSERWTMTMRNEISAMANKIEPNPNGRWFNTTSPVRVGDIITTNGVNYSLGNVRFGFDNDGDFVPDYNAWLQPISQPDFDPTCFRLIRTTGVLTATRGGGNPPMIINFTDQLYFTNLPSDNTNVTGLVYYTFIALSGPCNVNLSPYQEVASGFDNEKFNGDYGQGIPPIEILEPEITIDKSSTPDTIATGSTTTYRIPFANTGDADAGLTVSSGGYVDMPLTITDEVPDDMQLAEAATYLLSGSGTVSIRYSTDSGATWSTAAPVGSTSTWPANKIIIQWSLDQPLPKNSTGNYAEFKATVPSGYSGPPFIENEACIGLGDAEPFACDTAITMVTGNNAIGDTVWQDDNSNGLEDTGEAGIADITVSLYWDKNGDGVLDDGDVLIKTTVTADGSGSDPAGYYLFDSLPDGNYLVVVDDTDADLPDGYIETTPITYAVALDPTSTDANPVNHLTADFGFGPVLSVAKTLSTANPAYEGDLVTFSIDLTNNRPGDGTGLPQPCVYEVWATSDSSATKYGNPFSDKLWELTTRAFGTDEPDGLYAVNDYSQGYDRTLAGTGYNIGDRGGDIISVEALFRIYVGAGVDPQLTDDDAVVGLYYNDAQLGTNTFNETTLNTYLGASNAGWLVWPVTGLPPNGTNWEWSDFSGNLDLVIGGAKTGSADKVFLYLDVMGFRITTDTQCGGPEDAISILPLTDTYDADRLEFVSASPAETSVTVGGTSPYANTGTISWDNLGPLYAGQTKSVEVTFRALEPPDNDSDGENDPVTTTNTASVTDAKFYNGKDVNDDSDTADVTINPTGTIGDTVWNDNGGPDNTGTSGNGIQDGSEQGLPGVTVNLYADANQDGTPDGPAIATAITDENGEYLFTGLRDGSYIVRVDDTTLPGGSGTNTHDLDGDNDSDSGTITLNNNDGDSSNDDELDADFGYTGIPNYIYGNVWEDNDGDGTQDDGENGLPGVTVYLYNCGPDGICGNADDTIEDTDTTDANGDYLFTGMVDGDYYVVVDDTTAPLGADWSNTADPDDDLDSNSGIISVAGGNGYGSYDFGYHQTGSSSIGDMLYVDWNGDATQDTGEEGIPNVTVTLYEDANGDGVIDPATDALIATTTTDANGEYLFENLPAGDYIVKINAGDLPDYYVQTYDPDEGTPGTVCTICDSMSSVTTDGTSAYLLEDFGYQPQGSGSIGDTVWNDTNGNGILNAGESGLANITVRLYEDTNGDGIYDPATDALIAETVTDADGNYLFTNLPPGHFLVDVDTADSDLPTDGYGNPYVLSTNNDPHAVTLTAGETYLDADFGFTTGGVIGDRVWQDNNGNGNQDEGEPGIENVVVGLYTWTDVDGDGVYDEDVDEISAIPLATDTTDSDGNYLFTGLPAGNYVVKVDSGIPAGFTQSGDPDWLEPCTGTALCDGASGVNLRAGQIDLSRDFGYVPPGVIGDYIWFDANGDGVQDESEGGIGFVTVQLCSDVNCDTVLETTETDSDGYYSFGNLSDGTYYVKVDASSLPAGVAITYDLDDGITSPDGVTAVTLSGGGSNLTADFGYRYYDASGYSISGTVFFDAGGNGDGTSDTYAGSSTDTPYANITVYLWRDGKIVAETTTDNYGYYSFDNLPAGGDYTVSVDRNGNLGMMALTATPNNTPEVRNFNTTTDLSASVINQDFGFYALMDMGDLPSSYEFVVGNPTVTQYTTLFAYEGAMHVNTSGNPRPTIYLGAEWDAEPDGQPDTNAGIESSGGDLGDEDGIDLSAPWYQGQTTQIAITVYDNDPTYTPYVAGWFDWNQDGKFDETELVKFGNLGAGTHTINLAVPATAELGRIYMRFRIYATQSPPEVLSPIGAVINGEVEDYWKLNETPTAITLAAFEATPQDEAILIIWETAMELDHVGFNLYRSTAAAGPYTKINATLIPPQFPGEIMGGYYEWLDTDVQPGVTYFYKLEDIDIKGVSTFHGPVSIAAITAPTAVRLQRIDAHSMMTPLVVGLIAVMGLWVVRRRRR